MILLNLLPDTACIDIESGDEARHYILITWKSRRGHVMTLSGCTYVIAFPAMITCYLQSRPVCGFMLYSWVLDVIRWGVVTLGRKRAWVSQHHSVFTQATHWWINPLCSFCVRFEGNSEYSKKGLGNTSKISA